MTNKICDLLELKYPIFQGAMAWVSDGFLAGTVSENGGLGIIAGAAMELEQLKKNIDEAKKITNKKFAVNLMMQRKDIAEQINICIENGVKVVTTGAGNPGPYMGILKEGNIKVIPVIPNVSLAMRMERIGADAVIAEGCESGGHIGKTTTMALLPQIVNSVNIPVIAAGGIASGKQYLAALSMGASGIQCGTIFLTAKECGVHQNFKNEILEANDTSTVVTGNLYGHPVRVIKNKLAEEILELEKKAATEEEINKLAVGSYRKAVEDGDVKNGSVMAGQVASMVKQERTVKEILEFLENDMRKEYEILKSKLL